MLLILTERVWLLFEQYIFHRQIFHLPIMELIKSGAHSIRFCTYPSIICKLYTGPIPPIQHSLKQKYFYCLFKS